MTTTPQPPEPRPDFPDRVLAVLEATAAGAAAIRGHAGLGETESLQLFLLDGLLEAVEWANDGVSADEAACMWLAGLRWHRALTGTFPPRAPEPLPRWIDEALGSPTAVAPGDPQNLLALAQPQMASTGRPAFPAADGPGVLPRAAAIALLPRVDEATTARLATDAAALTHGSPAAHRAAGLAAVAVRAGLESGADAPARWRDLLDQAGNDGGAALAALRMALAAAAGEVEDGRGTGEGTAVVQRLDGPVDPDTAAYAAALVASATGYRPAEDVPAAAAGDVIGQMHRRWVEAVLGVAP